MAMQIQQLVIDIATELHTVTEIMSGQFTFVSRNIDHIQQKVVDNQKLHDQRFIAVERFADKMNRGQIRVISRLQTDVNPVNDTEETSHQSLIVSATAPPQLSLFSTTTPPFSPLHQNPSVSLHTPKPVPEYMVNISINIVD